MTFEGADSVHHASEVCGGEIYSCRSLGRRDLTGELCSKTLQANHGLAQVELGAIRTDPAAAGLWMGSHIPAQKHGFEFVISARDFTQIPQHTVRECPCSYMVRVAGFVMTLVVCTRPYRTRRREVRPVARWVAALYREHDARTDSVSLC